MYVPWAVIITITYILHTAELCFNGIGHPNQLTSTQIDCAMTDIEEYWLRSRRGPHDAGFYVHSECLTDFSELPEAVVSFT